MNSKILRWLGIVLILETGLLHLITAQKEYDEAAYMGYLFIANFCGALVAVLGVHRRQKWGWYLGALVAAGSIVGYIWSRTLGMPAMNVEEWLSPFGLTAISVEILMIFRPWQMEEVAVSIQTPSNVYLGPLTGLIFIAVVGGFAYRWDYNVTTNYGHHVGSLNQVCSTPETTMAELEEKYGVEVSLAATSMMGSIVDVRIKIIDADKAHALLQNQVALLVGQERLILAPHLHSHGGTRLKTGKIFIMFFPTQQIIHPGSDVSLVFGAVRVEPVTVR